jgi:hypothetical protein
VWAEREKVGWEGVLYTVQNLEACTVKKFNGFPSSAGMSLTKLSLAGKKLIIPD